VTIAPKPSFPHDALLLIPNFGIESTRGDATVIVRVSGDVDLCTAPWLARELARAQRTALDVVIDLERVTFMDCAGLHVLADFARAAEATNVLLSITPGPRQVQKLFELTGVETELPLLIPALDAGRTAA
jgi:anti-anti-sigma factor